VRVAVGTSNYRGATTYAHGQAWAQMVNRLNAWSVASGISSVVTARGASDMELDWNKPATTRAWVDGYAAAYTGSSYLYNYGDAAGCPPYGSCNNGWTQEDVWYVSWGAQPAYPFPEIYTVSGSTARQWYQMSLYGHLRHGQAIEILGSLTQWAAAGYCCTNPPEQGWTQLYDLLNADSRTAQSLPYSSDITWQVFSPASPSPNAPDDLAVPGAGSRAAAAGKDPAEFLPPPGASGQAAGVFGRKLGRPSGSPEPEWRQGVIESGLAPFPSGVYRIENQWQQLLHGQHTSVYAGALGADPARGVVVVQSTSVDNARVGKPREYLATAGSGPLRIVRAEGLTLVLQGADGSEFMFDSEGAELAQRREGQSSQL
jgi:hypothetical protein